MNRKTSRRTARPDRAIVLAAGLGTRLRHLRNSGPKALLAVNGRTLLDRVLDKIEYAGIRRVMINLHYKGDMIRAHLAKTPRPSLEIAYSDESEQLLDTGGGIAKTLDFFEGEPFYSINAKLIWRDGATDTLHRLASLFDAKTMDALLLMVPSVRAGGYEGLGDYDMDPLGRLVRRKECLVAPFVYSGIQIVHPKLFEGCPRGPFSLNLLWDKAEEAGRLYGIRHDGPWMHVSTPEALSAAEEDLKDKDWS